MPLRLPVPWRGLLLWVLAVALVWAALANDLWRQQQAVEQGARDDLRNVALVGAQALQASTRNVDLMLQDLRAHWGRADFAELLGLHLARLGSTSVQVWVVDGTGQVMMASGSAGRAGRVPAAAGGITADMFVHLQRHGVDALHVFPAARDQADDALMMRFARPLLSGSGVFAGFIALALPPADLLDFYRAVKLGDRAAVGVVADDGTVLVRAVLRRQGAEVSASDAGEGFRLGQRFLQQPAGEMKARSPVDGVERWLAWQPAPGYPLTLIVGAATTQAANEVAGLRWRYALFGLVLTLVMVAVGWLRWSRWRLAEYARLSQDIRLHELRRARDELAESEAEVRALHHNRVRLSEEERKRISHAIHDELGQRATVHRMELDALSARLAAGGHDAAAATEVARLKASMDALMVSIRQVAEELRPSSLEMGLHLGLAALVQDFNETGSLQVRLDNRLPHEIHLDESLELDVFRVVQEGLTNVARHAQASRAEVFIAREGAQLVVRITDDGIGVGDFRDSMAGPAVAPRGKRRGFGLVAMRERAMARGGSLTLKPAPGRGAQLEVRMPLQLAGVG